jgi:hypothetical protein
MILANHWKQTQQKGKKKTKPITPNAIYVSIIQSTKHLQKLYTKQNSTASSQKATLPATTAKNSHSHSPLLFSLVESPFFPPPPPILSSTN